MSKYLENKVSVCPHAHRRQYLGSPVLCNIGTKFARLLGVEVAPAWRDLIKPIKHIQL